MSRCVLLRIRIDARTVCLNSLQGRELPAFKVRNLGFCIGASTACYLCECMVCPQNIRSKIASPQPNIARTRVHTCSHREEQGESSRTPARPPRAQNDYHPDVPNEQKYGYCTVNKALGNGNDGPSDHGDPPGTAVASRRGSLRSARHPFDPLGKSGLCGRETRRVSAKFGGSCAAQQRPP